MMMHIEHTGRRLLIAVLIMAFPSPTYADETQRMTVAQLADKCSKSDSVSKAFCLGLATGLVNQLQAAGNYALVKRGAISEGARELMWFAGAACGSIDPKLALDAFIGWAKIHPEWQSNNGLVGAATAIKQAWPCDSHIIQ